MPCFLSCRSKSVLAKPLEHQCSVATISPGLGSNSERISPPPHDAAVPIARTLVEALPDRVLWGTDFPHPNLTHDVDEADLVDLVPRFAVSAAARSKLLVDNPGRLYGFAAT